MHNLCSSLENALSLALDDAPTTPRVYPGQVDPRGRVPRTVQMRRNLGLRLGYRTDVGRSRTSNEDSLLALEFTLSNK